MKNLLRKFWEAITQTCKNVGTYLAERKVSIIYAEAYKAEVSAKAYALKMQAGTQYITAKLEAEATAHNTRLQSWQQFWSRIFFWIGHLRRRFSNWRIQRMVVKGRIKISTQRVKATKWRAFGGAMRKFFIGLRAEIRRVVRWGIRYFRAHPIHLSRFFRLMCATAFTLMFFAAVVTHSARIYSLAPLGILWSILGVELLRKKGYFAGIGKNLLFMVTVLWMGTWILGQFSR